MSCMEQQGWSWQITRPPSGACEQERFAGSSLIYTSSTHGMHLGSLLISGRVPR